jgi:hypothetical protein
MATAAIPIGQAPAQVAQTAVPGPQNPSQSTPKVPGSDQTNYFTDSNVAEQDKNKLIETIGNLRSGWMQDRMERIRVWMLSVMMEKGIQWVGWDQTANTWFDALAEVRNNNLAEDGESVELEKWMNNITLMFKQVFVGNLTRAIPHSVVRPANAEKPKDTMTAKASQDVLQILDRKNQVRRLMRQIFETLYTFGVFFRYTRPVLDGVQNGYDTENIFEDILIETVPRMKCMGCGLETPTSQLPPQVSGSDEMPACPGCNTAMGPESYYGAGEGNRVSLQLAGTRKIPRASVRQTIHSPLEIDVNPNVEEWWQSEILSKDCEIGYGEALKLYPTFREKIQPGASVETTPNADWERLMRTQQKSVTSGYASDLSQSRPTYSENWMNPAAFWTLNDPDFAQRMEKVFPEGAKMTLLGGTCVDLRPAVMRREWSSCRLYEKYGPYCPSIAERVVPFNQRLNAAMQMLDDWMQRSSTGLNVMDVARLDPQKVDKRPLVPGHVFGIPMRINGEARPISETFMHWDLPLNPAAWNYPNMLIQMCQLLILMPPQSFGGGTQEGVDTATGQEQQLGQATSALKPYWENVKDECADAARNEIYWVKQLMKVGALDKLWRVEETKGAGYRNQSVDWSQMEGEVDVFSDEDQGLPTTPDELRQSFIMIFQELSKGNPAAQEWMKVPANQQMVLSTMLPGSVSPVEAQITKTQIDIQTLVTKPPTPYEDPADGSLKMKLPVEPDKNIEDFETAKQTVRQYMLENCDLRESNQIAWENLNDYIDALEDMDAQVGAERAARQQKVTAAGQPPKPGPDPQTQTALKEILKQALAMVDREAQLAQMDPLLTKGTITGQVQAADHIVQAAIDAQRLVAGGK